MTPCEPWITVIQCLPSPTLPWYRWQSPLVSTPLAALGIDRVLAIFWGIYTELHSREFPGIQSSPRRPLLPQPPWYNTRPPGPLQSQHLVWFQASRTSSAAFWGIGLQRYPVGNSLELCRNPTGIPLDTLPRIIPGLEDHLPEVLLGIPGTLLTLHPDWRRPCLVKPSPQDSIFLAPSVGNHIRTIRYPKCVCASHF